MCSMDALSPGAGQPATVARRDPLRRLGAWYRRHVWVATALLIVIVAAAGFVVLQAVTWNQVGDGVIGRRRAPWAASTRPPWPPPSTTRSSPRIGGVRLDAGGDEPLDAHARPARHHARRATRRRAAALAPAAATCRSVSACGFRAATAGRARRARRRDRLQEGPRGGARRGRRAGAGRAPQAHRRSASPSCRRRTGARSTPSRSSAPSSAPWLPGAATPARSRRRSWRLR